MKAILDKKLVVLIVIVVVILLVLIFYIIFSKRKRRRLLKEQHNALVQESKIYELLMSLETVEFLNKLLEFLQNYKDGTLTMSFERLTMIVSLRRDRLHTDQVSIDLLIKKQTRMLSDALVAIAAFIVTNFVIKNQHRKRLKKLKSYFKDVASELMTKYSKSPKSFFVEDKSGKMPFEEVKNLLTDVLASAGAKKSLRTEAKKLMANLEKLWRDLGKLEATKTKIGEEAELWKKFYEEHKDLIDEFLDEGDYYL